MESCVLPAAPLLRESIILSSSISASGNRSTAQYPVMPPPTPPRPCRRRVHSRVRQPGPNIRVQTIFTPPQCSRSSWVARMPSRRARRPAGRNKKTAYYSHCSGQCIVALSVRKKDRLLSDVMDMRPSAACARIESVSSTIP
jgi:hypothetical protein